MKRTPLLAGVLRIRRQSMCGAESQAASPNSTVEVKQMRRILVPVLAGFLLFAGPVAFARNAGGGAKHSGGTSAGHISDSGLRNSNGVTRADREKGLDRATERRSDSALEHSNALDVHQGKGRDGGKGYGRKK